VIRKMIGIFTAIAAALAVVGVAWAGGDELSSSTSASLASSTSLDVSTTSPTADTSTSVTTTDSSTPFGESTSTTLDDGGSSTSTTIDDSTGTSLDDDDNDARVSTTVIAEGSSSYRIPGVGSVTLEARLGVLALIDVSAPGWSVEIEKHESDRIEIELEKSGAKAEFEARLQNGRLAVEIEVDPS